MVNGGEAPWPMGQLWELANQEPVGCTSLSRCNWHASPGTDPPVVRYVLMYPLGLGREESDVVDPGAYSLPLLSRQVIAADCGAAQAP